MKHTKLKTFAVLLLGLGLQAVQAQTALFVKQKAGTNISFNLSTIKSLTFDGSNVTVNKKDATASSFDRSNVQYINFGVNTDIAPINGAENSKLTLFPNPAKDVLNVEISNAEFKATLIEIVGIDGKVALRTVLNNTKNSITLSTLSKGIYLLRSINGTITTNQKFIKQ